MDQALADIQYYVNRIRRYLEDIERGYNRTADVQTYLNKIKELFLDVGEENIEKIPLETYIKEKLNL